MPSPITAVPPADAPSALVHFRACLAFETDCWDVHDAVSRGEVDFMLLDVRGREAYAQGHAPGAVSLPHAQISAATLEQYDPGTVFVAYCAGPHCNGAHRAALRLAELGRPVKIMIGGITGWLDEGFELVAGAA
jgi:rhodanese-related sulfurtransferase